VKRAAVALALAVTLLLGGCAPTEDYPASTAQSLQQAVLAVSQASAAGDWAGAQAALDDAAARLAAAVDAGEIGQDRAMDISIAIDLVRADLQALIAAQQQLEQQQDDGDGNEHGNDKPDKPDKPEKGGKDD
jgi:hypothetical protein